MKKIIIVLFLTLALVGKINAQVVPTNLTPETKAVLISELKIKLSELMNQLVLLLVAQLTQQQQTNQQLQQLITTSNQQNQSLAQIIQNTTPIPPTPPPPTPSKPPVPTSTTDGVDPQINIDMDASLNSIAESLVTDTSCPNKPIIIFSPQNYVDNKTYQITTVSVVGDTITFSSNQSQMLMGINLYDPCLSAEELIWSYTSPRTGTIGTNTSLKFPAGGVAEAAILSSSEGVQTITVTASEPGGETVTKSVKVKMGQESFSEYLKYIKSHCQGLCPARPGAVSS